MSRDEFIENEKALEKKDEAAKSAAKSSVGNACQIGPPIPAPRPYGAGMPKPVAMNIKLLPPETKPEIKIVKEEAAQPPAEDKDK